MSNLSFDFILLINFCVNLQDVWIILVCFYIDSQVFEYEKECIFVNSWICVVYGSEVVWLNDYIIWEIIGENIVIVCGCDNILCVFYNVCLYCGYQLLSGEGKVKNVIICFYYVWVFKLDGNFVYVCNCENVVNFDSEKVMLVLVCLEEYVGFVFINMNLEVESVEMQLLGLQDKVLEVCLDVYDLKLVVCFIIFILVNWKNIVDNYLECYYCGLVYLGFLDFVQVDCYWYIMYGKWMLQYGFVKLFEQLFKFEEGIDVVFYGFWLWLCIMFNVMLIKGMMIVIYEFLVDEEIILQNYDIYFINEELIDDQKVLIEWYCDVFCLEDLCLVESVQKGLKFCGYCGQGCIMVDNSGSGIFEYGIVYFYNLVVQVFQL